MPHHRPTQELDLVLRFIVSDELTAFTYDTIKEKNNVDTKSLIEIMGKLEKDGYIDKNTTDEFGVMISYFTSTFDGRLFFENGGYTEQKKRLKILTRNKYIQTILLTYGTALAGLYGIFEILKWLFHHEGWHLPF